MTRTIAFVLTLMFLLPSDGSAQAVPGPGHRRITQVAGTILTGALTRLSPETIWVSGGSAGRMAEVPVARIEVLETSPGQRRNYHVSLETSGFEWQVEDAASNHLVSGLVIGAGLGVVGGLVLYEIGTSGRCDPADNTQFYTCTVSGPNAVESAVMLGAVGALLGAVIGRAIPATGLSVRPYVGGSSRLGVSIATSIPKGLP